MSSFGAEIVRDEAGHSLKGRNGLTDRFPSNEREREKGAKREARFEYRREAVSSPAPFCFFDNHPRMAEKNVFLKFAPLERPARSGIFVTSPSFVV